MQKPFLNQWTYEQIQFSTVQAMVKPLTAAGQRLARSRTPFLCGDEALWLADQEDAHKLSAALSLPQRNGKELRANVVAQFMSMPDLEEILRLLQHGESLFLEHMANLKRFFYFAWQLGGYLREADLHFVWWNIDAVPLLSCLQQSGSAFTPTFSLVEVGDVRLREARAELEATIQKRGQLEYAFLNQLKERYKISLRRDQTLVIGLDYVDLLQQARSDPQLQMRMQTMFEVVFAPIWPSERDAWIELEAKQRADIAELEQSSLQMLTQRLFPLRERIVALVNQVAHLDELLARVAVHKDRGYTWTALSSHDIQLVGGYPVEHPEFTPIDLTLHNSISVLTGPNMGGKTAALKTVLTALVCHHYGYPAPVTAFFAPLYAHVRYVGGDAQSLQSGLSSFGAEIVAIQEAQSLPTAFVCFDEVGRSTNPIEGAALIEAILREAQVAMQSQILCATHFPIRLQAPVSYFRIKGVQMDKLPLDQVVEDLSKRLALLQEAMDYHIVEQTSGDVPQEGLTIAKWLGLSDSVVQTAESLVRGKKKG
ncbi:MutS-related protein [Sulfoacidibacillus thermotolerans]|uniref:DNA mismatch repair proteins mutS family domain-containing protein n=1 Tax=Sulfoacidibacillus thermotolerans TaxID=1765684 RepID=A0A2U3D9J5_SULT2|nr:hypothetical protein [Sulfoacidibacillus thermotolerans]PWI57945.1 hypothetical protein BM613_05920 [Sulfoacidibacillus thermotolerans]